FALLKPEQTATMSGVSYHAYNAGQHRVLISNSSPSASAVNYSGGPYKNLVTGTAIGSSPLKMAAHASYIGYKPILTNKKRTL
ncbi:MAG: hypothetical protein M3Q06_00135, partial [Bacteroidota bacterium]|nr:hypothetical protein [Bacteroidota bacterium]